MAEQGMDRRAFVAGAAAAALLGGTAAAQDGAKRVPMPVEVHGSWLSWVTAATGCLRALGVNCDNVDVAAQSGYAFHMCIMPEEGSKVSKAGPTTLPWSDLADGVRLLGRATLEYRMGPWGEAADWVAGETMCLELAKREVDAGRPSILWGTGIPEFGIVVGYDGDAWLYKWAGDGDREMRVRNGDLQDPAGQYMLMFPSTCQVKPALRDHAALVNALEFLHRRSDRPVRHFGLAAYDPWIAALQGGPVVAFDNGLCAQDFNQAKQYARDFLARLAQRNPPAAGPLAEAAAAYRECAAAMAIVAQLFPFPAGGEKLDNPTAAAKARDALATARDAETVAAEAIEKALVAEWPEE